jgi:hypothetical protein
MLPGSEEPMKLGFDILLVVTYIVAVIWVARSFCRWRNRIISHLTPGDDPTDED